MSVRTLPSLPVGGKVTQQIIKRIPQPSSKSTLNRTNRIHNKQRSSQNSSGPGWPTSTRSTTSDFENQQSSGLLKSHEENYGNGDGFIDTARYRNSYKHNLCLDMLQDGFHQAFCELFNLLETQKVLMTDSDNFDAPGSKTSLIQDDQQKLEMLKENLISAETASRRGRSDQVYQSQLVLAEFFSSKEDSWLSDYFYQKCLATSSQIRGDGRQKEGEANYNLGIAAEKKADFEQAVLFTETSYNLSKGKVWQDSDGVTLHRKGCESLQRMYTSIAEQIEEADADQAIEYLQKAFEMAKEGGSQNQEGKAGFRLGKAYEDCGNSDAAIKYFADYLEICNTLRDDVGKAQACHALADAHHSQGDVNNAINYLTMYLDIAKRSGQGGAQGAACSGLGALYNSLGQYGQATDYLIQAFESAKKVDILDTIELTRTECGVVSANEIFERLAKFIVLNERSTVKRVISWRDTRADIKIEDNQLEVVGNSEDVTRDDHAPRDEITF